MRNRDSSNNIALIGFSGTGKSAVARKVAELLGWEYLDTDDEVVKLAGKSIPEIFEQDGEAEFRRLEHEVLKRLSEVAGNRVIATGGGVVIDPRNRDILQQRSVVICLEASPETIYQRLLGDNLESSSPVVRPLLVGSNPLERIKQLKESRQSFYYGIADRTVYTDKLSVTEVSLGVISEWQSAMRGQGKPVYVERDELVCVVVTGTARYPIFVGWGILAGLGKRMKQVGLTGTAVIIGDEPVFTLYGSQVKQALEESGFTVRWFTVPPGESTKNIGQAIKIYDFLIENHIERNDIIVALGGGMAGDLAGFVAATYLRGLPWVQVPTTLMAMVDASIGGKVAVNHPTGKNLIGAFHQPSLVLTDVRTLTTLPRRELTSGWAEVIKHGMIADAGLLMFLEEKADRLLSLEEPEICEAVAWSACVKAQVVSEDEKETGRRVILNYGHTVGHALEAATGYERFLHGEAVAIGMMAAADISARLKLLAEGVVERQRRVLQRYGLPTQCSGVSKADVITAMELDKKVRSKAIRWVLLEDIGKVVVRSDVPDGVVLSSLREVIKV